MVTIGHIVMWFALAAAVWALVASVAGELLRKPALVSSAHHAMIALAGLLSVEMALLGYAFFTNDFSLAYVANHSSLAQPPIYRITAIWGGQSGSLLLWVWLLSLFSAVAVTQNRESQPRLVPWVIATLAVAVGFFVVLMLVVEHPFEPLGFAVADGQGLNPLLQNPYMAIHPPALYTGYIGFAIPFAFAMASLIAGRLGSDWIRVTRRWTLFSWVFLSVGILLGAHWAYLELGWGGYWAWDPVENASFMPWLVGTAFLHSVIIQEKRNMLKVWNMVLVILTYGMTIFGTFLTRSGVIQSVHSFARSDIGPWFMRYLMLVTVVGTALIIWRRKELASPNRFDSTVSRESSFLLNNLILLAAMFAVLWGTIFPILSEAATGTKVTVGPPFFNRVMTPIGLVLLFLTGVGPIIAWRKASPASLKRAFALPLGAGVVSLPIFMVGGSGFEAGLWWALCVFVLASVFSEFWKGMQARHRSAGESYPVALATLISKNRRRYGGYIVHIGIVLIFAGVVGNYFKHDAQAYMKPGESVEIAGYTLLFESTRASDGPQYQGVTAAVAILKDGDRIDTLHPEKRIYPASGQPTSEAAVRSTLKEDVYLTLAGYQADGAIELQAHVLPLVKLLWLGGLILVLGTGVGMWPDMHERRLRGFAADPALQYAR